MITWFIIGITVLISYLAFQNSDLMSKLQFNAAQIIHRKEYYRLVSHAFIHANWSHLGVNMLVLYFFVLQTNKEGSTDRRKCSRKAPQKRHPMHPPHCSNNCSGFLPGSKCSMPKFLRNTTTQNKRLRFFQNSNQSRFQCFCQRSKVPAYLHPNATSWHG